MAESEVKWEDEKIVCLLPLTMPKSKVQVKRGGEPVAVRQNDIKKDDLLEWQISYYKEGRVLIEAGKMLELSYRNKIISREELEELKEYAKNIPESFDEYFGIKKEESDKEFLGEFKVIFRHVPIIRKDLDNQCFVEAELKHKQRAVGYQPMLYIFIPAKNVVADDSLGSLVGRTAKLKEVAKWFPTKNDVIGTMKTFAVLSHKHRDDVVEIIERILS